MIQTIKFKCETITPMFLSGADGKTPELRAPSIKGALRFWWRALNANLVIEKDGKYDYTELKRQESEIFGGTGVANKEKDKGLRSKVIISIDSQPNETITTHPTPHNKRFSKDAFAIGSRFEMTINVIENNVMTVEQVKSLFIIISLLGGLGNRSRRGFGSFKITEIDGEVFSQPNDVESIESIIMAINPSYPFVNNRANYPFVKLIEIGLADDNITRKIGNATHNVKKDSGWKYGNAMGDARNRFSSPIYVSAIKKDDGKLYPIITTLNTVPPNGRGDESIQQTFKKKLL